MKQWLVGRLFLGEGLSYISICVYPPLVVLPNHLFPKGPQTSYMETRLMDKPISWDTGSKSSPQVHSAGRGIHEKLSMKNCHRFLSREVTAATCHSMTLTMQSTVLNMSKLIGYFQNSSLIHHSFCQTYPSQQRLWPVPLFHRMKPALAIANESLEVLIYGTNQY